MEKLFLSVLRMSLTGGYVILFLMLVRLFLKKAPKAISYALWSVAAFRLLCPVSFESIFSLLSPIRSAQTAAIPQAAAVSQAATIPPAAASHPIVFGLFRPKIYLPAGLAPEEKSCILRHEQTHIRRFDHIVKPFAFLILSIHWFNPLVWAAFSLMGTDMELSCDERVIRELGGGVKKTYSSSLLSLSAGKHIPNGGPLAFGEGNVKARIKNVLNYKKPAFRIIAVSVLAVIAVGAGLMTDPKTDTAKRNSSVQSLYAFRTQYVGDNSAVGNIAGRLPLPDTLTRGQIALSTARAPYTVEIGFGAAPEERDEYVSDSDRQSIFDRDAVLFFALIQNADQVDFNLGRGESDFSISRTREWADSVMGKDVWACSDTEESFSELYDETAEKFREGRKAAEQPAEISGFVAAEGTAPLSDGGKALVRLVMTGGQYFSGRYAGYGGGIYADNYRGSYELQVVGADGTLLSQTAFLPDEGRQANFPGKFTLLFDDYNGDGNPDFTVGQWDSGSMNLYEVYTVLPDGTVKKLAGEAIPHLSRGFSVQFGRDSGSGFYAKTYNNATGETKTAHYLWNGRENGFYESVPASEAEQESANTLTSFTSTETDPVELGKTAFQLLMSGLTGRDTPESDRIASYSLNRISLLAGDIEEFCVALNYDFTTDSDGYVNPPRAASGKGTWPDNYLEIRIRRAGENKYEILSTGTGGGGQGLFKRFSIMTAGENDYAPVGCEYGDTWKIGTPGDPGIPEMLSMLDDKNGFRFQEGRTSGEYVGFQFRDEDPKGISLRCLETGGALAEYPIGADYRIKVPEKAGTYSFFADITWNDDTKETVFFRVTVSGGD